MAVRKYTNDIEIDHIHREDYSGFLHFEGAKGLLLSHIEELRGRLNTHHYINSFLLGDNYQPLIKQKEIDEYKMILLKQDGHRAIILISRLAITTLTLCLHRFPMILSR